MSKDLAEPWTQTAAWAFSELHIAIGRVRIAIARSVPWPNAMETRAVREIIEIRNWQEQERQLYLRAYE